MAWIENRKTPTPAQGDRLARWVGSLRDYDGRDVGVAETLTRLIRADKQGRR